MGRFLMFMAFVVACSNDPGTMLAPSDCVSSDCTGDTYGYVTADVHGVCCECHFGAHDNERRRMADMHYGNCVPR